MQLCIFVENDVWGTPEEIFQDLEEKKPGKPWKAAHCRLAPFPKILNTVAERATMLFDALQGERPMFAEIRLYGPPGGSGGILGGA